MRGRGGQQPRFLRAPNHASLCAVGLGWLPRSPPTTPAPASPSKAVNDFGFGPFGADDGGADARGRRDANTNSTTRAAAPTASPTTTTDFEGDFGPTTNANTRVHVTTRAAPSASPTTTTDFEGDFGPTTNANTRVHVTATGTTPASAAPAASGAASTTAVTPGPGEPDGVEATATAGGSSCDKFKCALDCEDGCGWDRLANECVGGATTSDRERELRLGDCPATVAAGEAAGTTSAAPVANTTNATNTANATHPSTQHDGGDGGHGVDAIDGGDGDGDGDDHDATIVAVVAAVVGCLALVGVGAWVYRCGQKHARAADARALTYVQGSGKNKYRAYAVFLDFVRSTTRA